MNEMLQLGPFIIQKSWIIIAVGLIVGYLLLSFYSPFRGDHWKEVRETTGTGLLLFIITFLFGSILLKIDTFVSDPLAVISYPSGIQELYLAFLFLTIYFVITSIRRSVSINHYLHAFLYLLLPASISYAFFEQKQGVELSEVIFSFLPWSNHPVSLYIMIVSSTLLIWLLRMKNDQKDGIQLIIVYFVWVLTQIVVNVLDNSHSFFGTPVTQLFYLFLFSLGVGVVIFSNKR